MHINNQQYGMNWPDTWVFFHGHRDSSILVENNVLPQNPLLETCNRLDPGRAFPKPEITVRDSCGIVFDGHLYNQKQLCQELKLNDEENLEAAEILLEAYLILGESFVNHLSGTFSFILWDENKQILIAVRDPIGVYPLFHADTREGRFFSISIQALLAQPGVSSAIDRTVLTLYLSLSWGRKEETIYQHIKRIPPCHLLKIQNEQETQIRYWYPMRSDGKVEWLENASQEKFAELLEKVSSDFLQYGQIGIYLSGGLDSVAATAFLTDHTNTCRKPKPTAYSLVFPNIGEIEEPTQRGVSESLGLHLFITSLINASGSEGLLQAGRRMNLEWPVPMQNFWKPAYNYLGNQAREDKCNAIITGVGGDEWLGLSPNYAADLIQDFDFPGLYRLIMGMWYSWPFPLRTHIYNGIWKFGLRPLIARRIAKIIYSVNPRSLRNRRKRSLYQSVPEWISPDKELMEDISYRYDERVEESLALDRLDSFYLKDLVYAIDHPMNSMDLEEEFENSRRMGIPVLGFYQHQEVVSYLYRFPPRLLNTGRPQKGLVREILQKRFPNLSLKKQKKIGATDNFREIVLSESPALWERLGGVMTLSKLGIVDSEKADNFFSSTINDPDPRSLNTWLVWHLVNYESWLRNLDK